MVAELWTGLFVKLEPSVCRQRFVVYLLNKKRPTDKMPLMFAVCVLVETLIVENMFFKKMFIFFNEDLSQSGVSVVTLLRCILRRGPTEIKLD